jgi:SAM-dependent methyltransferase
MVTSPPRCRSCSGEGLELILSLGDTPLANALLDAESLAHPEPTYPLNLGFCPACSLVQILESVPPEKLFRDYPYFSSFSDTMLGHAASLAKEMLASRRLGPDSLVMEAASNDGYLLRCYRAAGVPVLGIEPAENVARVAISSHNIPTLAEFFGLEMARRLRADGLRASLFHAHNVLAHVPDLNGFVAGIRHVLRDDGLAVVEAPYLRDFLDHCEFDTIYHEHLCYFSLTALERCFRRHDLLVADVRRVPIHGGSLRLYLAPFGSAAPSWRVRDLLQEEAGWGVDDPVSYRGFARKVERIRTSLRSLLGGLKRAGHRLAAYGASAKGATLLNFCGIGRETLDFVVDRSTVKQGRYTPGSRLPILPPEHLLEAQPDYVLLLVWNFAEEVLRQQAVYCQRGGKFIVPIPAPRVLTPGRAHRAA